MTDEENVMPQAMEAGTGEFPQDGMEFHEDSAECWEGGEDQSQPGEEPQDGAEDSRDEPAAQEDEEPQPVEDTGAQEDEEPQPAGDTGEQESDDKQSGSGESGEDTHQQINKKPGGKAGRATSHVPARPSTSVLSIDGQLVAETDAQKARNDLLDLLESQKTGRVLAGTIQGVESQASDPSRSLAVIYHGEFKVLIPAEEAVELPEDLKGRTVPEMYHYMLNKRLGAETDYIIKGVDADAGLAVASRLEAMRAKRKEYYMGTDRDGNYRIYAGVCAEARVVSVIRTGIFIDLFGQEVYIPLRELSYQRWMDAAGYFQSGQRVLVKVLGVDRSSRDGIKVTASVKQASENPYEKALRRYSVGNRYVGTVSMVDTNGVFVALDGGIDCLCSYPKRGRPPRGSRATVRILGINDESNRIWGAITHIAAPH